MKPLALVVDDEPHIRRVAELAIRAIGCEVVCAVDGREAWRLIQERKPDVLVSDVQMPNINGIQLVNLIRTSEEYSDLPIVLITAKGYELPGEVAELIKTCHVVCKPFSPAALSRHVLALLKALADNTPATTAS
jgi:CheY-like chemotaxis protein